MTEPRATANDPVREDWDTRSSEDVLAQLGSSIWQRAPEGRLVPSRAGR